VLLRFRVSGGRAVFGGGLDSVTLTTNAAGRAAVSGLQPLQTGAYQIEVTATYQGQTAQATITQNNFATMGDATRAGRKVQSGRASGATGGVSGGTAVGAAAGGGLSKLAVLGAIGDVGHCPHGDRAVAGGRGHLDRQPAADTIGKRHQR